jgi:hypothetical protein
MYHGRYRILRCIDEDRTGTAYNAVDTMTNVEHILKVVPAETITGTGFPVRFKGDISAGENVAFLSEAGLDQDTKSVFMLMNVDEDADANAVTKVCETHLPEAAFPDQATLPTPNVVPPARSSSDNKAPFDSPRRPLPIPEAPPLKRTAVPIPLPPPPPRASMPAIPPPLISPLPPPLPPPEGSSVSGTVGTGTTTPRPLPPPAPPPERATRTVLPLPQPPPVAPDAGDSQRQWRPKLFTPKRFVAAAVAIVVGSLVYFFVNRGGPETATNAAATTDHAAPAPVPAQPPVMASETTASGERSGADTKAPTNWIPSETERREQETTPPKTTPPKANKSAPDHGSAPTTKRRRDTLY